jgi:hypothetical protein
MNRTTIFWLAAMAFTAVALGVQAQDIQAPAAATPPGPSASQPDKPQVDRNGDGSISKVEAQADAELARRFSELDTDNSGKLDQAEFARFEIGAPTPK